MQPGLLAAVLFAVDPAGLGGVLLRARPGPARERWLLLLQDLLPSGTLLRKVPLHVAAQRLAGELDLAATLQAGRPVMQQGLLAEAAGGVLLLAMAERLTPGTAALVTLAIDRGAGFGVVALDEGLDDDERPPAALRDRLALHIDTLALDGAAPDVDAVVAARRRLAGVQLPDAVLQALAASTLALGVDSTRALLQACRAARALAALDGRRVVTTADAATAAGLVLAPRATRMPAPPQPEPEPPPSPDASPPPPDDTPRASEPSQDAASPPPAAGQAHALDDVVLQAALSSLPRGLLARLALGPAAAARAARAGRAGAAQAGQQRGRPLGARRGESRAATRLNLIETLRAAAPWQAVRQPAAATGTPQIQVRREDFRFWRFKQRSETTTVFVVDASGSAALHRLAETKGAVELLLADCYVRRDSVAVIAFRGAGAEVLLPPTRSLVRAKRSLAGLPGGGGTPLAAGIGAAVTLGAAVGRRGATPVVVLLTDGRANVALDGSPGRARAQSDALAAAQQLRLQGLTALLIDTSPQAQEPARLLAQAMGARYLPLPHAGAELMSQAVRQASAD